MTKCQLPRPKLIAITGGIGSGKSVVSKTLRILGYPVYDTDSRAKWLMDSNDNIKQQLIIEFGPSVVVNGEINRRTLAGIVFNEPVALEKLNAIVHSHVRTDISAWNGDHGCDIAFVETAILYQSGLDMMVDEVWDVIAPRQLRIKRIMSRNMFSEEEAESRVVAQEPYKAPREHENVCHIINDGVLPLLPQIEALIDRNI